MDKNISRKCVSSETNSFLEELRESVNEVKRLRSIKRDKKEVRTWRDMVEDGAICLQ